MELWRRLGGEGIKVRRSKHRACSKGQRQVVNFISWRSCHWGGEGGVWRLPQSCCVSLGVVTTQFTFLQLSSASEQTERCVCTRGGGRGDRKGPEGREEIQGKAKSV